MVTFCVDSLFVYTCTMYTYLHVEFSELTLFVEGSWVMEAGEDSQHCRQSPETKELHFQ